MARIRNIKPDFFKSEKLLQLDYQGRLFYIGLWGHADRYGIGRWVPQVLWSEIFPFENFSPKKLLEWKKCLIDVQSMKIICHEDENYFQLPKFKEHQSFSTSEIGKYQYLLDIFKMSDTCQTDVRHLSDRQQFDLGHRTKDIGHRTADRQPTADADPPPTKTLLDIWNSNCGSLPKANGLSEARQKKLSNLWPKQTPDQWVETVRRIAASKFCTGNNDRTWRANFDWLLRPDTWLKVNEGQYDDRQKPKSRSGGGIGGVADV